MHFGLREPCEWRTSNRMLITLRVALPVYVDQAMQLSGDPLSDPNLQRNTPNQVLCCLQVYLERATQPSVDPPCDCGKLLKPSCTSLRDWTRNCPQVYMEQAMQLSGDLVFTVRKAAPLRFTQAQVG